MEHHPIESLMKTAMENLKEMVDVNKIVGDAVETPDGSVIIPISRVSFGFAAGGTEFEHQAEGNGRNSPAPTGLPFGGGSGGGVMVQPVAFLVAGQGQVRLLPSITTPCSIGSSISPPARGEDPGALQPTRRTPRQRVRRTWGEALPLEV